MADDLPPPSLPNSFHLQLSGFISNEHAERFGKIIVEAIKGISRSIDLSRLAGISVVADFDAALRDLDRGFNSTRPLTRTKDGVAEGVAMTPMVKRDGINKWQIMLNSRYFIPLEEMAKVNNANSDALAVAIHTLAHECAHVHIATHFDEMFPEKLGTPWKTDTDMLLLDPAITIWEEYAANVLAGPFCSEYCQRCSEDTLIGFLNVARKNYQSGLEQFYQHKNWLKLFEDAGRAIFEPLRGLAYVLGDMDGASLDWTAFPAARKLLDADPLYNRLAVSLHCELRKLAENWHEWDSLAVFAPLMEIAHSLYSEMGINIKRHSDGNVSIDIINGIITKNLII